MGSRVVRVTPNPNVFVILAGTWVAGLSRENGYFQAIDIKTVFIGAVIVHNRQIVPATGRDDWFSAHQRTIRKSGVVNPKMSCFVDSHSPIDCTVVTVENNKRAFVAVDV